MATAAPPPATRVPRRASTHLRDATLLAAAGLSGWGAAPLLGWPGTAGAACLAVGVGAAGGWAVRGQRAARRQDLQDRVLEALAPLLGVRHLDRRIVRLSRWTRGWPGTPRLVRIHYAPGAPDQDPGWLGEVTSVLSARLLAGYRVVGHDRRRCRLRLAVESPRDPQAAPPALQQRAERLITELVGPTARVTAAEFAGDELRAVTVTHQAGARLAAAGYRARIERVISTTMPGRWRAVWDMEGDSVRFEVRPALPSSVWLPPRPAQDAEDLLANYRQVAIPCAIDEDGREVLWRPARVPMVMLTGSTGSGKTSAAHALLGQITANGWPVWVLDAKRVEFLELRTWPNVQIVAGSIPQQVALVQAAWELMEHRYELIEAGRATVNDFEPLVVFLDEFAEFRSNLLEWYAQIKVKGDPTRPATLAQVASLARKARTARIHLVLSTQRPDAEFLGGEALAVDTPIPTPTGWTTMGRLQVGDQVFAPDGGAVRVTATTEVAHGRPCYRVRFSDGSNIITDAHHLWAARSAMQRAGDIAARRSLTRSQRWPEHEALTDRLQELADGPLSGQVVTVAQFESVVGRGRIGLLRRGLHDGRYGVAPVASRRGARVYRAGDLIGALLEETRSPAPSWRSAGPQIITTEQLAASVKWNGRSNWSIPVTEALDLPDVALPIDPWLLGYWLGDGNRCAASIATADEEVLVRIRELGYRTTHYARYNHGISTGPRGGAPRPSLKGALRELGLLGYKHIPDRYLRASIGQREALLAGLLDADGTCSVRSTRGTVASGQVSFANVNRALIDQVAELVASLGFLPSVTLSRDAGVETSPRSVVYGRQTQTSWVLRFTPDRQVFRLTRKQAALAASLEHTRRATTRLRYVVAVEQVASVPVRCITVDSREHLYLAGRAFIATHNCRDNFGFRISMGRLSPQGAMMMWENPAVGVSLPRGVTGRAIATHDDGRPVEVQCYRFPDLDAATGTVEHALLAAIRPAETRWPRLLIVPPDTGVDDSGEQLPATFAQYAHARWDLAANRPDLDPLAGPGVSPDRGRQLSSTMAALGIAGTAESSGRAYREVGLSGPVPEEDRFGEAAPVDCDLEDEYEGYASPALSSVRDVQVGDLIEVEEGSGVWVVVDEPPEEDLAAPGNVAVSWRGDADECGYVSMPEDLSVQVRRPEEDLG